MRMVCKSSLTILMLVVLFCGVAIAGKEPGQGKHIYVMTERNITSDLDIDMGSVQSRKQVADWWEADLIKVLTRRGGYDAKLIMKRDEFIAGPDTYLLTAKILNYNSGSKTARIIVGFGAGFCSMDLHLELFGGDSKQIFAKDDHVSSGRDWVNVARKLNENTLVYINDGINPAGK